MLLSSFSINLLAFYHEYHSPIGHAIQTIYSVVDNECIAACAKGHFFVFCLSKCLWRGFWMTTRFMSKNRADDEMRTQDKSKYWSVWIGFTTHQWWLFMNTHHDSWLRLLRCQRSLNYRNLKFIIKLFNTCSTMSRDLQCTSALLKLHRHTFLITQDWLSNNYNHSCDFGGSG